MACVSMHEGETKDETSDVEHTTLTSKLVKDCVDIILRNAESFNRDDYMDECHCLANMNYILNCLANTNNILDETNKWTAIVAANKKRARSYEYCEHVW